MQGRMLVVLVLSIVCMSLSAAQAPISSPVKIDIGVGAGVSLPNGTLSNSHNTGYHFGGKVRLSSFMPFNVVGSGNYNRLKEKITGNNDSQTMLGVGLEYGVPSVAVKPYLGVDGLLTLFEKLGPGSSSASRIGLGLGAGVEFTIPAFGSFDTQVKYQILNLGGKEINEDTISQIAANVTIMFSVL